MAFCCIIDFCQESYVCIVLWHGCQSEATDCAICSMHVIDVCTVPHYGMSFKYMYLLDFAMRVMAVLFVPILDPLMNSLSLASDCLPAVWTCSKMQTRNLQPYVVQF